MNYSAKKSTQEVVRRYKEPWTSQDLNYQLTRQNILDIPDHVEKADVKKDNRDPSISQAVFKM